MESLQKLSVPAQALERIKKLAGDLRLLCAKGVFKEAIEGNTPFSQNHLQVVHKCCKHFTSITMTELESNY